MDDHSIEEEQNNIKFKCGPVVPFGKPNFNRRAVNDKGQWSMSITLLNLLDFLRMKLNLLFGVPLSNFSVTQICGTRPHKWSKHIIIKSDVC